MTDCTEFFFNVESGEIYIYYVLAFLLVAGLTVEWFLVVLALYLSDLNECEIVCLRVRLLVCVCVFYVCVIVCLWGVHVLMCFNLQGFPGSLSKLVLLSKINHFILNSTAADMDLFF